MSNHTSVLDDVLYDEFGGFRPFSIIGFLTGIVSALGLLLAEYTALYLGFLIYRTINRGRPWVRRPVYPSEDEMFACVVIPLGPWFFVVYIGTQDADYTKPYPYWVAIWYISLLFYGGIALGVGIIFGIPFVIRTGIRFVKRAMMTGENRRKAFKNEADDDDGFVSEGSG